MPSSITPTFTFENVEKFLQEFLDAEEIVVGVASKGPASAYALIWEWGNVRQVAPGPKTVLGTNPDGKMVWLSIQAPFGYIRINTKVYWQIVREELMKVNFVQPNGKAMQAELERAANRIAAKIAIVVRDAAPEDSGDLRMSVVPIGPNDSVLSKGTDDYETLGLGDL